MTSAAKTVALGLLTIVFLLVGFPADSGQTANAAQAESSNVALVPSAGGRSNFGGTLPVSGFSGGFAPQFTGVTPESIRDSAVNPLTPFDTVVLVGMCDIGDFLSNAQFKSRIEGFVQAGGKLVIYDSECTLTDYSNFIFPFGTSNPGAQGAQGNLTILENNELSSSDPSSPHYINVGPINTNTDAVGDANVFVTNDPRWCTDMTAQNILGVTGPTHAYANLGSGIIIYDGLDKDYMPNSGTDLERIWELELKLHWDPTSLPCGASVTRNIVIFLAGLASSGSSAIENSKLARESLQGFVKSGDFLFFSYAPAWCRPTPADISCGWQDGDFTKPTYSADDTKREDVLGDPAVFRHTDVLDRMIQQVVAAHPGENLSVYLIGYSLGGIIATHWASQNETDPNIGLVKAIVPVDSPIGGINVLADVPQIPGLLFGDVASELETGDNVQQNIAAFVATLAPNDLLPNVVTIENSSDKVVNSEGIFCPSRLIHRDYGPRIGTGGAAYPFRAGAYSGAYRNLGEEGGNCFDALHPVSSAGEITATHGFVLGGHDECWVKAAMRIAVTSGRAGDGNCESIRMNPGDTVQRQFAIGPPASQFEVIANYGSIVDLSLVDPNGSPIGPDTTADNVFHEKGDTFERYVIGNPAPGTWTAILFGADLPPEGEDIALDVWIQAAQNRAPVADAGSDAIIAEDGSGKALVQMDGSASFDPDSDPLGYAWSYAGGTASGPNPQVELPLGTTTLTLIVNDGQIDSSPDTVTIEVATDIDGDGFPDPLDLCPNDAEDYDDVEDEDGCPDVSLDTDGDGILDADDACPDDPEDADGFEDSDGCPDLDNDGDGILDAADGCPNEPEDLDHFQDADGCPEPCRGGDVNGDGRVNFRDLILVARAFGSRDGDRRWNPRADINYSGRVDLYDVFIVLRSWFDPACRPMT